MDDHLAHGLIGSNLKHTKLSATEGFPIASCLPQGTEQVVGFCVGHSLVLSALDIASCPKATLSIAFGDDVRTFDVHPSGQFVAVALENKKLLVLSLLRPDPSGQAQVDHIAGHKILYSIVAPKKVTNVQWTDAATLIYSDKFGNIFTHAFLPDGQSVKPATAEPNIPLGHYSVVTAVTMINAMESKNRYIVSSDKDEKIRVSRWPHAYDIVCCCMGHTQYVTCLCSVQNSALGLDMLVSAGGDGRLCGWNYENGSELFHVSLPELFEPTTLSKHLHTIYNTSNTSVTNVVYHAPLNLIIVSIEFFDEVLIFSPVKTGDSIHAKLMARVPLRILPIRMSVDPLEHRLWISGVPLGQDYSKPEYAAIQVFDVTDTHLTINEKVTTDIRQASKQETLTLPPETIRRTFVIHAIEENLRKMQARRGGVSHAGTGNWKDEPATKMRKLAENGDEE